MAQSKHPAGSQLFNSIRQSSIMLALLVATLATVGSLFFQYVLKYPPCELCWFQRIFMYPQVIVLGAAMFLNDTKVWKYSLPLSIIGFIIAVYHYLLQWFPTVLRCTSETAECAQKQFNYLGFVTIPLLSAVAFLLIILFMLTLRKE